MRVIEGRIAKVKVSLIIAVGSGEEVGPRRHGVCGNGTRTKTATRNCSATFRSRRNLRRDNARRLPRHGGREAGIIGAHSLFDTLRFIQTTPRQLPMSVTTNVMFWVGRHSDRTGERRWHVALSLLIGGVAFAVSGIHGLPGAVGLIALTVATSGVLSSSTRFPRRFWRAPRRRPELPGSTRWATWAAMRHPRRRCDRGPHPQHGAGDGRHGRGHDGLRAGHYICDAPRRAAAVEGRPTATSAPTAAQRTPGTS